MVQKHYSGGPKNKDALGMGESLTHWGQIPKTTLGGPWAFWAPGLSAVENGVSGPLRDFQKLPRVRSFSLIFSKLSLLWCPNFILKVFPQFLSRNFFQILFRNVSRFSKKVQNDTTVYQCFLGWGSFEHIPKTTLGSF